MTVPVPESIRATAIETAPDEAVEAVLFHRWNMHTGYCACRQHFVSEKSFVRHVLDAILPAVVAQVQADALREAWEAIELTVIRTEQTMVLESEYPALLASREGGVESLRAVAALMAEYREKGENSHE